MLLKAVLAADEGFLLIGLPTLGVQGGGSGCMGDRVPSCGPRKLRRSAVAAH